MNVSKEIIQKLKDMLNYSPTGKNDHNLHFSFIEDIEVMDDFRNKVNQKIISTFSKKPFEFLSKKNNKFAQYKNAFLNGEDIIFRGAPHVIIFYAEERENSGAYKAYKYAKGKKEKHVVNLWSTTAP